ncbi:MAG: hypothetical protein ACK52W_00680 [Alphaproteobacteria bacterium]
MAKSADNEGSPPNASSPNDSSTGLVAVIMKALSPATKQEFSRFFDTRLDNIINAERQRVGMDDAPLKLPVYFDSKLHLVTKPEEAKYTLTENATYRDLLPLLYCLERQELAGEITREKRDNEDPDYTRYEFLRPAFTLQEADDDFPLIAAEDQQSMKNLFQKFLAEVNQRSVLKPFVDEALNCAKSRGDSLEGIMLRGKLAAAQKMLAKIIRNIAINTQIIKGPAEEEMIPQEPQDTDPMEAAWEQLDAAELRAAKTYAPLIRAFMKDLKNLGQTLAPTAATRQPP